jgi:hypothetical protein
MSNHQTVAASFEVQTGKLEATVLEAKPGETVATVLRLNRKKPSQWFWVQTMDKPLTLVLRLNQESHAPRAWCRPHTASLDFSIIRPLSTRPMSDHPRSFAPGLILLPRSSSPPVMPHLSPTHHETSKHDSPNKTKIKVKQSKCHGFEFKPGQVNDSSQSNQGTGHLISQNDWSIHEVYPLYSCAYLLQDEEIPREMLNCLCNSCFAVRHVLSDRCVCVCGGGGGGYKESQLLMKEEILARCSGSRLFRLFLWLKWISLLCWACKMNC